MGVLSQEKRDESYNGVCLPCCVTSEDFMFEIQSSDSKRFVRLSPFVHTLNSKKSVHHVIRQWMA